MFFLNYLIYSEGTHCGTALKERTTVSPEYVNETVITIDKSKQDLNLIRTTTGTSLDPGIYQNNLGTAY